MATQVRNREVNGFRIHYSELPMKKKNALSVNIETEERKDTHVENRELYVQGCGQRRPKLCKRHPFKMS